MAAGGKKLQKKVLIVGKNQDTREILVRALSGEDLQVFAAADGVSGLFQFGLVQPQVVILDVDGWETLQRLRSVSNVPIIALTANDWESGVESLNRGADYFVTKPLNVREVAAKVQASLRRQRRTADRMCQMENNGAH
jgi:DNA-binding response OmpR family regulator